MNYILTHIHQLIPVNAQGKLKLSGKDMASTLILQDAWLWVKDGKIKEFGIMSEFPDNISEVQLIPLPGRIVFPGFCDSHTHLVFAASREQEFVDKIQGLTYEEIARKGGGILQSAVHIENCSEAELYDRALERIQRLIQLGTTALEIKSGYGLTLENELKMLRVIARLKNNLSITLKSTFLGAHAVPLRWKNNPEGYVQEIIEEMIPVVGAEKLADYVDVFCDEGFFTPEQTLKILSAAAKWGLKPKIHANELAISGGVQAGIEAHAISVDHLERIGIEEIMALQNSTTLPVLLPGTSFFLRIPYGPARELIEAGLPLVLASDYNPGSSPSGNMQFIFSLGCIYLRLLPLEALVAITLNGAAALEISDQEGSLEPGKKANFNITHPLPDIAALPYYYGESHIAHTAVQGVFQGTAPSGYR